MPGIFISYRREDAPGHAGRLFDRLRARFGSDVFMDVTGIEAGVDFGEAIDRAVGSCDVLLAVIGPQWTTVTDRSGRRRLDDPNDFIRLEIGKALLRNVRVVPALVENAVLPAASDLPDELAPLLRRHAIELRDTHWDADVDQLVATIARIAAQSAEAGRTPQPPGTGKRRDWRRAAAIAVLVAVAAAGVVLSSRGCGSTPSTGEVAGANPPAAQTPPPAQPTSREASTPAQPETPTPRPPVADPKTDARPVANEPKPETRRPPVADAKPEARPPAADDPKVPTVVEIPDVKGTTLAAARRRLAGAGITRVSVRWTDDPDVTPEIVVDQATVRADSPEARGVVLSVAARATLWLAHLADEGTVARKVIAGLNASGMPEGVAIRLRPVSVLRKETAGKITFSDENLRRDAAAIARGLSIALTTEYGRRVTVAIELMPSVRPRLLLFSMPPAR